MKHLVPTLLALCGLVSSSIAAEVALKEGDCWSYAARPGEEESFLVIRKIETLPKLGEVAHISVFGLRIKNPSARKGIAEKAGHVPIAAANLRTSLKAKVQKKIPDADWTDGYRLWRGAYEAGKGGVFTKSVSECVGFMEEAIARANKG